jgi:hypothetical protein
MKHRRTRKRGGGVGVSERYFGVTPSLGVSGTPSTQSTASYIRPPLVMQGGGRRKQRGGNYMTTSQYYGAAPPSSGGAPPLSSAATSDAIRPPLVQRGGFTPAIMGGFVKTAHSIMPTLSGLSAYKLYRSYYGTKKHKSRKNRK